MAKDPVLTKFVLFAGLILSVFVSGCRVLSRTQQLLILRNVSKGQDEIKTYLNKQEALFSKLVEDVKNNQVKKGQRYSQIIRKYGDPVFCQKHNQYNKKCLFRHPTDYFSSDKVYLYFDSKDKLAKVEYLPFSSSK